MYPVIANFGPFTISSLGVFLSLAFFFGSFKIWRKAREEHMEDEDIFDIIFLSFFGGLIFARLFFILLHFAHFGFRFNLWLDLAHNNGFSWMGFLVGSMFLGSMVCKKKKIDFWEMLDVSVNGVLWANIFVLVGQFLDCSSYGRVTNLPWGVKIPGVDGVRHPIAFYEILVLLFIIYMVKWLDKRYRLFKWYQNKRGKANPGFLWLYYLSVFVITQFLLSLVMIDEPVLGPLTSYQILLAISMLLVGFNFWLRAGNEFKLIDDETRPQTILAGKDIRKKLNENKIASRSRVVKKESEKEEKLKVIRPATKTPAMKVKTRERKSAPKRFSRGKGRVSI